MLVVSDTSPITNLLRIGHLNVLKILFGEIFIPPAVYEELSEYQDQKVLLDAEPWIRLQSVINEAEVNKLREDLDEGEAQAIVLAKELQADFLIIDERKGRVIAETHGIRITGLVGILVKAKQRGYFSTLKPILDQLIFQEGFRISPNLYKTILEEIGE